jgi:SAM-dependent methyltransferase
LLRIGGADLPAQLGYTRLTGIDLNPRLADMPYSDAIRYEVSDFMKTPFPDGSFKAITSISVIEHGFRPEALLSEMSRLLQPGGYFVSSFDYWPDKIDTTEPPSSGMDWLIFSRQGRRALHRACRIVRPRSHRPLEFACMDKVISCAGKDYTFATLVLRKAA